MIIVEGPDGAGKTTLVRELSREFGLKIHPKGERVDGPDGPPKQDERERVWEPIGQMVTGNSPVEIYDRLFFSELVYGPIWRGETKLTPDEERMVQQTLKVFKVPVIFCLPPVEVCADNSKDSTHNLVMPTIREVYEKYIAVATDFTSPYSWIYDYTKPEKALDIILRYVSGYLLFRKERTWGT